MPSSQNRDTKEWHPTYNWIMDVESLENYVPGGYHPIMIGDILHDRYRIVDKIGYATVWLSYDTRQKCYVAVKVRTADSALQEAETLRAISSQAPLPSPSCLGRDSIPSLLDEFKVYGPNGTHRCYTMALAVRSQIHFFQPTLPDRYRTNIVWKGCTSCCLYPFTGLCPWRYAVGLSATLIQLLIELCV